MIELGIISSSDLARLDEAELLQLLDASCPATHSHSSCFVSSSAFRVNN